MAREFWEVAQALVRLAPESPEALALTGGVVLRDLSDEECRRAFEALRWPDSNAGPPTIQTRLKSRECLNRDNVRRIAELHSRRLAFNRSADVIGAMIGASGTSVTSWERGETTPDHPGVLSSYLVLLKIMGDLLAAKEGAEDKTGLR
jgi:DNA-binding transcriptional regulator YiaG